MARAVQLPLPTRPSWGGRRQGAGRKRPPGRRPGVRHQSLPIHEASHPVHVTLRTVDAVRCLRSDRAFPAVRHALAVSSRDGFRIIEYSVQENHLHLLVEAENGRRLSSGVSGLAIRVARAVNRVLGRHGALWAERFHARALTSPRSVRNALVYVLLNFRKHHAGERGIDRCSSGPWFSGWREAATPPRGPSPIARAHTWLATVGWRRHGLIRLEESPKLQRR